MNVVRGLALLGVVIILTAALLLPLTSASPLADSEAWIYQSIRELQASPGITPTLNGRTLAGQNPLQILFFSLLPSQELFWFRLQIVVLGCILAGMVFLFGLRVFDTMTALFSSLITITSLGFIDMYGALKPLAMPETLSVLAVLIFSLAYIGKAGSWWYVIAHILAGIATISGGWIILGFYIASVIFLILLDLSPGKLLGIHPISGILIISGITAVFLAGYRLAAGPNILTGILSPGEETGFPARIGTVFTYLLPWLPLLVPAWMFAEKSVDKGTWRDMLPVKVAFGVGVAAVLFSARCEPAFALLSIPFSGLIIGYWIAHGLPVQQPGKITPAALVLTGILLFVGAFAAGVWTLIRAGGVHLSDAALGGVLIALGLAFFITVLTTRYRAGILIGVCAAFFLCWGTPMLHDPLQVSAKKAYMHQISTNAPLLVYSDDLPMRGYLGLEGIRPFIIGRETIPLGASSFLAIRTRSLEDVLENLEPRMNTTVVSSLLGEATYALIKLDPKISF
ncbi:MAG: hypothetical protein ACP5G0_00290 [Desulfomonilia bacterium]